MKSPLLLALLLLPLAAVSARAEDLFVKNPNASLLSKKSALSERVAPLQLGDKVDVVAKEGSWLKVKVGGKEGYVHQNSVGTSGGGDGGLKVKNVGSRSGAASETLAAKGGFASSEWARGAGKSEAGLTRMLAIKESIKKADVDSFEAGATAAK